MEALFWLFLLVLFLGVPALLIFLPFYFWNKTSARLRGLESRIDWLEGQLAEEPVVAEEPAEEPVAPEPEAPEPVEEPTRPAPEPVEEPARPAPEPAETTPAAPEADLVGRVKGWLLGGNTVARVGVVVLFFGVAYFLDYAIELGWIPLELRLTAAAVGGVALAVLGWRLRRRRRGFALTLQGGGAGIFYLAVYTAVGVYDLHRLLPPVAGLVLLVATVMVVSAFAVLQDARALAVLASVGGFLAPELISLGEDPVLFFSYYLVLDAGILAIALHKAWRELNLLGFLFTFVVGAGWGSRYYDAEYFAVTEPFLVLFFLLYLAVPVLFALRQPPKLRGFVDGSLVFGVPLVAFGLQSALVRGSEHGLAVSAAVVAAVYAALAREVRRRWPAEMTMLAEAFMALAVAFGTVAIPLAVDGRWTGTAWALEGAALVWVGVRQERPLARFFGLLVQLGAGVAFLLSADVATGDLPVLNSFYLGALMVSVAGFFSAHHLRRHGEAARTPAAGSSPWVLGWGVLWWAGAGLLEIVRHVGHPDGWAALLAFAAGSAAVAAGLRILLDWPHLDTPIALLLPVTLLTAAGSYVDPGVDHPAAAWGWLGWGLAWVVQYALLHRFDGEWRRKLVRSWHLWGFWTLLFLVTWQASWILHRAVPGAASSWGHAVWGLLPAAVVAGLPRLRGVLRWPLERYGELYLGTGVAAVLAFAGAWTVAAAFRLGDPAPLPYLPVLNPVELAQAAVLAAALLWARRHPAERHPDRPPLEDPARRRSLAWWAAAFLAVNGAIARAVHFWTGVGFGAAALWVSPVYQTAVSITWTLLALAAMVVATHRRHRGSWIAGATLLGAVVVKLFLVDLAGIGTVARIVSFVVVGLLTLAIGYLSPLPPRAGGAGAAEEAEEAEEG